jgi:ATP-dependent protease HslVU (ClpYQ) peptidase subunit
VCLIVWDAQGLRYYEDGPIPETVEHGFWAFGSGRDFAIAAMACGKSAREAVEIACQFDTGCGLGVDVMQIEFNSEGRC